MSTSEPPQPVAWRYTPSFRDGSAEWEYSDVDRGEDWEPLYAAPQPVAPDRERLLEALKRLVAATPEPELIYSLDEPPQHKSAEDHELGYALHLAREAIQEASDAAGRE